MSTKLILSSIWSGDQFKVPDSDELLFNTFQNAYPFSDIESAPLKELLARNLIEDYLESSNGYNDPNQPQKVYVYDYIGHELDSFDFSNLYKDINNLNINNAAATSGFNLNSIKSRLEELGDNYESLKSSILSKDTYVDRNLPLLVKSGNAHIEFLVKPEESSESSTSRFILKNSEVIQYTYSSSFDYCSIIDTSLHMSLLEKGALVELLLEGIPEPIFIDPRVEGIYKTSRVRDLSKSIKFDTQYDINMIIKDHIIFSERKIIYSKFTSYTHETRDN